MSREEILKIYANFVKAKKRTPSESELQKLKVTRNATRWHFNTVREMKEGAREAYPDIFKNIIDETLFNKKNFAKLEGAVSNYKRFVVTTAVTGCPMHKKFYKSLKSYCAKNEAMLLVIPITDPASSAGWELDKSIGEAQDSGDLTVVFGDLALNSNLYISGIRMSAKQIDPTTGTDRIGKDCSFIFGSPKQRLKFLPNDKFKLPHASMGTGAITIPEYDTERYMSQRTAYLADFEHKIAAIIVEIEDDEIFHFRQIQAEPKSGNFVDLGNYYKSSGKVERMEAEAFIPGDWHAGETDPTAKAAWKEVCELVNPNYLILHDLFNGKSISHHECKKVITKAIHAEKGLTSLRDELKITADEVNEIHQWTRKGCVVAYSNHDDFIIRYLEDGRWLKDHQNFKIANELAGEAVDGVMPAQYGVEKFMDEAAKKRTRWLKLDESFKICRIEQGAHGHIGPSGSRGSLANLEKIYAACNLGHSHTPGILRDAWQMGTTGLLDQGFNKGGSSWMHTGIIQYPNGSRQMINSIKGNWRIG